MTFLLLVSLWTLVRISLGYVIQEVVRWVTDIKAYVTSLILPFRRAVRVYTVTGDTVTVVFSPYREIE